MKLNKQLLAFFTFILLKQYESKKSADDIQCENGKKLCGESPSSNYSTYIIHKRWLLKDSIFFI